MPGNRNKPLGVHCLTKPGHKRRDCGVTLNVGGLRSDAKCWWGLKTLFRSS